MTRQKSAEICQSIKFILDNDDYSEEVEEALDMAIQALQQEPCDDCISRKETIRWVKTECNPYGKPTLDFESGKKVIEHLEQMPSAEPKREKWEHYLKEGLKWKCSGCGSRYTVPWSYCPNCGARME